LPPEAAAQLRRYARRSPGGQEFVILADLPESARALVMKLDKSLVALSHDSEGDAVAMDYEDGWEDGYADDGPVTWADIDAAEDELADLTGASAVDMSGLTADSVNAEVARYGQMHLEDQLKAAGYRLDGGLASELPRTEIQLSRSDITSSVDEVMFLSDLNPDSLEALSALARTVLDVPGGEPDPWQAEDEVVRLSASYDGEFGLELARRIPRHVEDDDPEDPDAEAAKVIARSGQNLESFARRHHGRPGTGRLVISRNRAHASEIQEDPTDPRQPRHGGRPYPGVTGGGIYRSDLGAPEDPHTETPMSILARHGYVSPGPSGKPQSSRDSYPGYGARR
jgi:hypothetical protein